MILGNELWKVIKNTKMQERKMRLNKVVLYFLSWNVLWCGLVKADSTGIRCKQHVTDQNADHFIKNSTESYLDRLTT